MVHLIGQLHVGFGAKLVRVYNTGIQRSRPHISTWPVSAGSLPNLTLLTESTKLPEADLHQIREVCESDEQDSVENIRDGSWAGPTKEHSPLCSSNPTLLHFESENDLKRVAISGDTTNESDSGQQHEVTSDSSSSTFLSDNDSVFLYMAGDRFSEIPVKQNALCDMTDTRSQLSVNTNTMLFNSDPNLLHSWRAESAQSYLSASFEMLPISSPDISPPCSVTNLPQLCENGKHRRYNGFFPVGLKSQVLGWKTDHGPPFSSLPSLLSTSNILEQSRFKYTAGAKESEKKPRQKEEIIQIPKSYHVMKSTDMNHKERLHTADTATSKVVTRNQGIAQMHAVGPQEVVEALNDSQWNFSEFKKMSCSRIAAFDLTSPLNDDKKLLPHQSRPKTNAASFRKFL